MRDYSLYLRDIIDAMDAVEKFIEGIDLPAFQSNDLISSAVIRKFEIIGEAAKNIPDDISSDSMERNGWNERPSYPFLFWNQI